MFAHLVQNCSQRNFVIQRNIFIFNSYFYCISLYLKEKKFTFKKVLLCSVISVIYIYIYRERERERNFSYTEKNFNFLIFKESLFMFRENVDIHRK